MKHQRDLFLFDKILCSAFAVGSLLATAASVNANQRVLTKDANSQLSREPRFHLDFATSDHRPHRSTPKLYIDACNSLLNSFKDSLSSESTSDWSMNVVASPLQPVIWRSLNNQEASFAYSILSKPENAAILSYGDTPKEKNDARRSEAFSFKPSEGASITIIRVPRGSHISPPLLSFYYVYKKGAESGIIDPLSYPLAFFTDEASVYAVDIPLRSLRQVDFDVGVTPGFAQLNPICMISGEK